MLSLPIHVSNTLDFFDRESLWEQRHIIYWKLAHYVDAYSTIASDEWEEEKNNLDHRRVKMYVRARRVVANTAGGSIFLLSFIFVLVLGDETTQVPQEIRLQVLIQILPIYQAEIHSVSSSTFNSWMRTYVSVRDI